MGQWADFFGAELGAAAALTGLVIVGISINITRILATPGLIGRAAETLIALTGLLVISTFALVPHQPDWVLGVEMVVTGTVMWAAATGIHIAAVQLPDGMRMFSPRGTFRFAIALLSSAPFAVCGVLLLLQNPDALYWTVPGVVMSLIATVINAWVLLVEILR